MEIRRLTETDSEAMWRLRSLALETEPYAFGESVEEHWRTTPDTYAQRLRMGTDNFVIGAFDGAALAGTAGFYRDQRLKRRHKGWVWGVFVTPAYRGRGVGRGLLERLIETARQSHELHSILLTVATTQAAARGLYASLGFRTFGIEPRALRAGDRYIDEEHMVLDLDR